MTIAKAQRKRTTKSLLDGPITPEQEEDVDIVHAEIVHKGGGLAAEWADKSEDNANLEQ